MRRPSRDSVFWAFVTAWVLLAIALGYTLFSDSVPPTWAGCEPTHSERDCP